MGRAKVTLEFIKNDKNLTKSFKSRTKILKKKVHELKTLCDVDVCMIVRGASIEGRPILIWPPNGDKIQPLIESYNKQSPEDRKRRTVELVDFLRDRNKKVEGDLAKLPKSNDTARFATWDERYERCSEVALREIVNVLEKKAEEAKRRVEVIKGCDGAGAQDVVGCFCRGSEHPRYSLESLLGSRNMQLEVPHNQAQKMGHEMKIPNPYYHQPTSDKQACQGMISQQLDHTFANPMFMMLNDSNYTYNNYNQVYFNNPPVTGIVENVGNNLPQFPPMVYYAPNMPAIPPCLQQYQVVAGSSLLQFGATQMEKYYDFSQIHMGDQ